MSSTKRPDQRVAVVIPAKDEAERIATTVRACRSITRVDLVIVVDDGVGDVFKDSRFARNIQGHWQKLSTATKMPVTVR